jgi:hypothetical protein
LVLQTWISRKWPIGTRKLGKIKEDWSKWTSPIQKHSTKMTKCLEEEARDHWEKGSSYVFDCATNSLMSKIKVGLFSGFTEKSSLVQTIRSRAEEVDDPTLYQICFLFWIELNETHPRATVCNFMLKMKTTDYLDTIKNFWNKKLESKSMCQL